MNTTSPLNSARPAGSSTRKHVEPELWPGTTIAAHQQMPTCELRIACSSGSSTRHGGTPSPPASMRSRSSAAALTRSPEPRAQPRGAARMIRMPVRRAAGADPSSTSRPSARTWASIWSMLCALAAAGVDQRDLVAAVQRVHVRIPRVGQPDLAAAHQVHAVGQPHRD